MSDKLKAEYEAYLQRADVHLGVLNVGTYAKFRGRLVKKLPAEEFAQRWQRYQQLRQAFEEAMSKGDTVNDAIQQLLDEHSAELLLEPAGC